MKVGFYSKNNMTEQELMQKIILGDISLSQGLMLVKVMFRDRLSQESYQWICQEVDHYEDAETMPDYRVVDCEVKVVMNVPYFGRRVDVLDTTVINNQLSGLDKPYASPNKMLVRQGIESIEKSLEGDVNHVEMELTKEQINLLLEYYTYPSGCTVERMYQQCSIGHIRNIISCVKNRLLAILQDELSVGESALTGGGDIARKKVFVSYGWDDDGHRRWVRALADRLAEHFEVLIDVKQPFGTELNMFMEQLVTKADRVLLILTPKYKEKADARKNGVGYESVLIGGELYKNQGTTKFIPVIRRGSKDESFPLYLGNRKGLMMTDDDKFEEGLAELIEDIKKN